MSGRPTIEDLDSAVISDLISDAEVSEEQAVNGPFYPERGITAESLRRYAAECRAKVEKYRSGAGAHAAILKGN